VGDIPIRVREGRDGGKGRTESERMKNQERKQIMKEKRVNNKLDAEKA